MNIAAQAAATALTVRAALKVIAFSLQLTSYLFPTQAIVKDGYTYDFIIVGAGSAGCVLASRLSENETLNVLLIEAGGDPPIEVMLPSLLSFIPHSRLDWNYTSENDEYTTKCHKDGVFSQTRGLMLGGSSGANYMYYVRGNPYDYQQWAKVARDETWNWENVYPYFLKSEKLEAESILNSSYRFFHRTDGPIGVTMETSKEAIPYLNAVREAGHDVLLDLNGRKKLGYTQPLFTIADGVRQSTCYSYLSPFKNRQNLHVLKHSLVTKVIFNNNKRATAVEVLAENGNRINIKARKEVIISAGAINSPKLLMLSGIGPRQQLRSLNIKSVVDLPVGYNLQDHVIVTIMHQLEKSNASTPPRSPHLFPAASVIGFVALNKSQEYPDFQNSVLFSPHGSIMGNIQLYSSNYRFKDDIVQKMYESSKGRNVALSVISKLHPKSRGQVTLRSADPRDAPLIYTGYYSDDRDLDTMLDYIEKYLQIMNTSYFRSVDATFVDLAGNRCSNFRRGSREYWRCYTLCLCDSMYHPSGTCAIGSVVDSQLRVLGVRGLRVVDASVMPLITSGNINAPIIMIAEKASDIIKETYK